jgi:small ubiquitin-related modifier
MADNGADASSSSVVAASHPVNDFKNPGRVRLQNPTPPQVIWYAQANAILGMHNIQPHEIIPPFLELPPFPRDVREPLDTLTVRVKHQTGRETYLKMKCTTKMGKVFESIARRENIALGDLCFLLDGERIGEDDTPKSVRMYVCARASAGTHGEGFDWHSSRR